MKKKRFHTHLVNMRYCNAHTVFVKYETNLILKLVASS